ncbi:MAG: 3'-5' exonuclease [Chloroflexi bacterium]|nr:3'-5' exonuclease [Chloroflexota bacterium]
MTYIHAVGIDVETTGTSPADDTPVELAAVGLRFDPATGTHDYFQKIFDTCIDPGRDIPPAASAVHHLTAEHVRGQPHLAAALHGLEEAVRPFEPTLLVAHNASFEAGFLPDLAARLVPGNPRWACTLRLAQHVWPDAPSFGLQTLRYWRGVMQGERTTTAHQAWFDAACSARLLVELCLAMTAAGETVTPRLLVDRSHQLPLLLRVPLGKHKGKLWSEVPEDYCRWLVDKAAAGSGEPFDPAVVETARAALRGEFAKPSDPETPAGDGTDDD